MYKYDVIPLTEGLDFNTATSLSKPGSLRDCMNYEFVDGAGLRRIDGFRPYDGTNLSNADKVFVINCGASVSSNAVFSASSWLYLENSVSNPNKVPFGYVFWNSTTLPSVSSISYVPFLKINCPSYADPFFNAGTIKVLNSAALSVAYIPGTDQILNPGDLLSTVYDEIFNSTTASAKQEKYLHDNGTAVGGGPTLAVNSTIGTESPTNVVEVWAEDLRGVTYSIGDSIVITGTTAKQVYVGDYVYERTSGVDQHTPWLVLTSELLTGTWASGTARLEIVPLQHYTFVSGTNDSSKGTGTDASFFGSLRLYRDSGADAMTSVTSVTNPSNTDIEDKSLVAVMWARHSEETALLADSVYGTDSNGITAGSANRLSWNGGSPNECRFTDADGAAEYMPLIAAGGVKAVIPTNTTSDYSGTGTVTYAGGTSGSGSANTVYRSNCIERVYPRFLHTGWIVPFDAGDRPNGFFNKLDRYKNAASVADTTPATLSGKTCTQYLHNIIDSNVPYSGASNFARIFDDQWKTTTGSLTDSDSICTAISTDNAATITNSYNWGRFPTSSIAFTASSGLTGFSGMAGTIPEDSVIRGISVTAKVQVTASTNSSTIYDTGSATIRASLFKNYGTTRLGNPLELLSSSGTFGATWNASTMAETDFTAGSTANLWGNAPLKLEDVLDPTFGVSFDIKLERSDTDATIIPTGTIVIDQITISVTYELPSVRLYFTDTAGGAAANTVIRADVIDYVVSKGALETGDAEGYLVVANMSTVTAAAHAASTFPYYTIQNNYYIYNDKALSNLVGLSSGEMVFNGFDSYRTIKAEGSLYTSVRGNVYANADYDAFFICSGAGRARIFDGKYMTPVYAINPGQANSATLDKPRHCAIKDFGLFLGYESGQVLISAPGQPSNFSALDGAGEIGIGDNVVGLQNMPGSSLCVACRNSMKAIVGSSTDDYALQTLVADEGAFEYSVQAAGGRILYMSPSGITTLDQSEKYGNFVGRRLSYKINPWLLPRVNASLSAFEQPATTTPPISGGLQFVRAHAIPYKNQYRVYFKDGTQLWMTLIEGEPQFTFVKYHYSDTQSTAFLTWDTVGPVYPLYVTTTVEKESYHPYKTLALFDPEVVYRFSASSVGAAMGIWHLDAGDYFCALDKTHIRTPIPHYFVVNYTYLQNPFMDKTIRKVRLEGQTTGYAPLLVYTKDGYLENSETIVTTGVSTPCSLPESPMTEVIASYKPEATMASVASTGRVISILFVGRDTTAAANGSTLVDTPPVAGTSSHIAQALFVQYEEGKEDA